MLSAHALCHLSTLSAPEAPSLICTPQRPVTTSNRPSHALSHTSFRVLWRPMPPGVLTRHTAKSLRQTAELHAHSNTQQGQLSTHTAPCAYDADHPDQPSLGSRPCCPCQHALVPRPVAMMHQPPCHRASPSLRG
ncbi:hypothetical protein L484_017053 [Morus notabilis]|uniref:Uncharacterized protein n=1 Tax=Morus notabilis TaxID=981085 RepID=W9RWV4_9ROSA|nr:hypothetical protein L484_017053 [Morus notabilis]